MDIIDPIDGVIGRILYGPMHKFYFDKRCGFCGMDVEVMLRRYHIRIWGRDMVAKNEIGFLVKAKQADWAEYILCRAGVPVTSELLNPRHRGIKTGTLPPPRGAPDKPRTFVDFVTVGLDAVLGSGKVRNEWMKKQTVSSKQKRKAKA